MMEGSFRESYGDRLREKCEKELERKLGGILRGNLTEHLEELVHGYILNYQLYF